MVLFWLLLELKKCQRFQLRCCRPKPQVLFLQPLPIFSNLLEQVPQKKSLRKSLFFFRAIGFPCINRAMILASTVLTVLLVFTTVRSRSLQSLADPSSTQVTFAIPFLAYRVDCSKNTTRILQRIGPIRSVEDSWTYGD